MDVLKDARARFANQMAQRLDDDIVFGLNEDALRWHKRLMREELKKLKPRWMPGFLWSRITNKIRSI